MENILKKPYEISIWEDFTPDEDKQYYRERKLMIIGSDTMTAQIRAVKPIFKENTNGTHTLSFTLYSRYFDEEVGEFVDNPFLPYMVNERKVKLQYDGNWYDFVIKDIEEDSESNSFNYNCIDSFINELSKNGFSIVIDTELENNQGTIKELATAILDGTDWKVGDVDTLVQKNDEALYAVKIPAGTSIVGTDMSTLMNPTPTTITITSKPDLTGVEVERIVYVFYSSAMDNTIPMQFLYREDGNYTLDEDGVINNASNYLLTEGTLEVNTSNGAVNGFRGKRIVQKEITKYDALTDHFVTVYEDSSNRELYMYYKNEYISPTITTNFVANSINFVNSSGWVASSPNTMKNIIYPSMYDKTVEDYTNTTFVPYMRLKFNQPLPIYNAGIISNAKFFDKGIAEGEKFVLRLKYGINTAEDGKPAPDFSNRLRAKVARYTIDEDTGNYQFDGSQEILSFVGATPIRESESDTYSNLNYVYYIAEATQSASYAELKSSHNPIGLFFSLDTPDSSNYYFIQEAQFFLYKLDQKNNMVIPNGAAPEACVKKKYYYYYPDDNKNLTPGDEEDKVVYAYIGNEKSSNYTVKYDKTFEKIRSITEKESNRFNLIQTLCEVFECWPRFEIDHEPNGAITIGSDGPQKRINFHEYIGKDNYSGFKYGINLKSIKRSLDSEQIVSKIIVKPNSNQYAVDGSCNISRASENPIRENFLLNFRYYVQHGLLDGNEVNNDLYLYTEGGKYLGYYIQLNKINNEYDSYTTELGLISSTIANIEAAYTAFKEAYNAAIEEINIRKNTIQNFCGVSYETLLANKNSYTSQLGNEEVQSLIQEVQALDATAKQQRTYYEKKDIELQQQQARREEILELQKQLREKKSALDYKFYQKYSKYIQEGSWMSEDYMDDNLYYLDAESVLYTSAFPKVSYTINVIELSQLEGYENYRFAVGDKTYIEDVEFFGYKSIDGVKTPYQEEVILSEITYDLDDPSSNEIKVQNYKTQFEDLFQRITATTQSLQFQTGNYNRAAASFNTDGSITQSSLQNSMINNSLILSNATDQSVVWDETGITITNLSKPNEIVRLVSGGILITNNGGDTWSAGVTGNGINTAYLTAGQIDASRINIISGGFPSFRWDGSGISAYKFGLDENNNPAYFQFNNFVRFDQFGVYGIDNDSDFKAENPDQIKQNAKFGLTWDGFFLKSDHNKGDSAVDGRIEISTDEDFQVIDGGNVERIKIGLLDIKTENGVREGHYGIRISDKEARPVIATNDEGMLWLTQKIVIGPDYPLSGMYYNYRAFLGIDKDKTWGALDRESPIATYDKDNNITGPTIPHSLIFEVKEPFNEETGEGGTESVIAIYDTGRLEARDAVIEGEIKAKTGSIGGLKVEEFAQMYSGITINSSTGLTIKKTVEGILAPTEMKFTVKVNGIDTSKPAHINWQYSQTGSDTDNSYHNFPNGYVLFGKDKDDDGNDIEGDGSFTVSSDYIYSKLNKDGILYIRASVIQGITDLQDSRRFEDVEIITLLKDADLSGIDLDTYQIVPNYPDVLKYINTEDEEVLTFSPDELVLKSYKGQEDNTILDRNTIDYELYLYSSEKNYYNTEDNKWIKLNGKIKEVIFDSTIQDFIDTGNSIDSPFNQYVEFIDDTTYKIKIDEFYNNLNFDNYFDTLIHSILITENSALKINLINKGSNKILANTVCNIEFGTTSQIAKLNLLADGLYASVRDAGLIFDTEGLHVVNGGFEIKNLTPSTNESGENILLEEKLFYIENNQLYMEGNGTFTGTINAEDGIFNGTVNAQNGTLGDLSILGKINLGDNIFLNGTSTEENPLIGIYSNNYTSDGDNGFYISNDGTINANQLSLGAGATIKKYIKLGNTWIINPEWINQQADLPDTEKDAVVKNYDLTRDSFIVIKESQPRNEDGTLDLTYIPSDLINIKQNGLITIGKNEGIKINGPNQSINSFNYIDGKKGWSINPIDAEFNNITARGSLKGVTFEYETNTVQSVGGILLVKPSSAINKVEIDESLSTETETVLNITTETSIQVQEPDYLKIGYGELENKLFKGINADKPNTITVIIKSDLINSIDLEELVGCPLINMGAEGDGSIVINGSSVKNIYPKTALSIFKNNIIEENNNKILNAEVKLVLGQMPEEIEQKTYNIFKSSSYGLYAENVFLKGSLISEGLNEKEKKLKYSGINTNSAIGFNSDDIGKFGEGVETGNIVLWAGADWSDKLKNPDGTEYSGIDIQSAKFKVDNFGNLYANSGYFVGTIITDATITASKIMTAEIEGLPPKQDKDGNIIEESTALIIRNADIGIQFNGNDNSDGSKNTIMELNTLGMDLNGNLNVGNNFTIKQDSSLNTPIIFVRQTDAKENITIIGPNQIGFKNTDKIEWVESEWRNDEKNLNNIEYDSYLTNNEDGLSVFGINNIAVASFGSKEIKMKKDVRIHESSLLTFYDDKGDRVKWQTVSGNDGIIGYDLYLI